MKRQRSRKREEERKLQERQTDRRSVKKPGREGQKGAVLWLINLRVLKAKRESNTHFQMSRVIMQTMTPPDEGGREGGREKQEKRSQKIRQTERYKKQKYPGC